MVADGMWSVGCGARKKKKTTPNLSTFCDLFERKEPSLGLVQTTGNGPRQVLEVRCGIATKVRKPVYSARSERVEISTAATEDFVPGDSD